MGSTREPSARFRSATEFPQAVDDRDRTEADALYVEMRECLIFTNRSRAQLIRWNDQHKQDKLQLKAQVEHLQDMISQLSRDKQELSENNQRIVSELELEISSMAIHLDRLSEAFEPLSEIGDEEQSRWSFLSVPNRFFRFLQAVKSIVLWWRDERGEDESLQVTSQNTPPLPGSSATEEDRRDRPQMYSDPASVNRSLLDE